ncbi:PKD domain-containing protein [Roseivirga misakiensis]|uniref:PKD domain-containing protein n=1 Tax=Roseivirga misakiensis TaxID=1563681 RepID=A0A1E5SKT3_9BACT|nr:PKD domain-containing protein [Roseivirga misakiensis]OEJ99732.1 hypothetical protein BFP71_09190 [Roseivirga misakiensis]
MNKLAQKAISASFVLFFSLFSVAQTQKPIKIWDNRYGGSLRDTDINSIRTADNGFLITSSSLSGISGTKTSPNVGNDDWWVVKTDAQGNFQWDFSFGGTNEEGLHAGAVQTADGNYVLAGRTRSGISGDITSSGRGKDDILVVKISAADRSILWQVRLGGNGADWAYDMVETNDGQIVIGGYTQSTNLSGIEPKGSLDLYLAKLNASSGDVIWERTYGGSGFESVDKLLPNEVGGVVVGAYSASTDLAITNNGSFDFWAFSTNAAGEVQWENLYGGSGLDAIRSMAKTDDGGYIFSGQSNSNASGDKTENSNGLDDVWIVKTDNLGNLIWEKTIGGAGYDWGQATYALSDGSFIVGGFSNSNISGDKLSSNLNESLDIWFFGLTADGVLTWQADFAGNGSEGELNIPYVDELNGDIYLSGGTQSGLGSYLSTPNFGGSKTDLWFAKYRLHELEKTTVSACPGQSAVIIVDGGSDLLEYQLQNADGSYQSDVMQAESGLLELATFPIVSDTTLFIYALSDIGDGNDLRQLVGEVSVVAGDELLSAAVNNEIVYADQVCYNRKSKIEIPNSTLGVTYRLLNDNNEVLKSKEGNGEDLVFRTPKLISDSVFRIEILNTASGCTVIHPNEILVSVSDKIKTKISFDRQSLNIGSPVTFQTINDEGIVSWDWTFNKKEKISGPTVDFTFKRTGIHWITLKVENASGCTKEIRKKILVKRKIFFGVPGVFWPCSSQGVFKAKLKHVKKVKLVIVDRYGKVVHAGKNEWHGFNKRKRLVPAGRYFYQVMATTVDGKPFQKRGSFLVSY